MDGTGLNSGLTLPALEKLKGRENYSTWAFGMKMMLMYEGTWHAVSPSPEQTIEERVGMRALATICLGVEPTIYGLVHNAKDAKEAWEKLQNAFQCKGLQREVELTRELTSLRLEHCSSVETYVTDKMAIVHKLADIGLPLPDLLVAATLIAGLPEQYTTMADAFEKSGVASVSDALIAKILSDVELENGLKATQPDAPLCANSRSRSGHGGGTSQKDVTCYKCQKRGHYAAKCRTIRF